MNRRLAAKIFIIVSILFIVTLCGIYGYRLVYYYRLEHPKKTAEKLLGSTLTNLNNIVTTGDGLYKEEKSYYYKGLVENNYVWYSGILWRVVRINEDGTVTMISDNSLTSMVFGYEIEKVTDSYVYEWLNNTFYSVLKNQDYLVDTTYCMDVIKDADDVNCKVNETSKIGMMSVYEYLKSSGSKGYLNNGNTYWTFNQNSENKIWFINQKGMVTNDVSSSSYHSYGIRPMVTVKGDVQLKTGNGTKTEPYVIEEKTSNILNEQAVGSYVTFSNQVWRISEISDYGVKLALNGYVKVAEEEVKIAFSDSSNLYNPNSATNIGYYLNTTFYNSIINKEHLVAYPWKIAYYNSTQAYDYKGTNGTFYEAGIGLLRVSDLFIDDFSDYALMTPASEDDGTIFTVLEDGRLYANLVTEPLKVRPAVVINGSLTITSGSGIETDPFILSEV